MYIKVQISDALYKALVTSLPHGCASVGDDNVRLNLCISRGETDVMPAKVICEESVKAGEFVGKNF